MSDKSKSASKGGTRGADAAAARAARQAEQLRANLKRRKAVGRTPGAQNDEADKEPGGEQDN